jgi:hypothetical protein
LCVSPRRADQYFVTPAKTPAKKTGINAAAIAAEIDELGAIRKILDPLKPKIDRSKVLSDAIRAHFDASPPLEPFTASGDRFSVLIGPRANERVIDYLKLVKAIGLKAFAAIARVSLTALEAGTSPAVVAGCVTSAATGARKLTIFERS